MGISFSTASKYKKIFKLFTKPENVIIVDYIFKNDEITLTTLCEETDMYESKVKSICTELKNLGLIDIDYDDKEASYRKLSGDFTEMASKIINVLD